MIATTIQATITAQQQLDDIEYGLRSIKACRGIFFCTGIHGGQVAKAAAAAAQVLGVEYAEVRYSQGEHGCPAKLREAKKIAQGELANAKARKRAVGTAPQIRRLLRCGEEVALAA